jgi:anti-anti-sigma factor
LVKITVEEKDDLIIIYFFGELASANFYDIEAEIQEVFNKNPGILALNFNGLDIIDSTGISFLIKIRKEVTNNNIKLVIYSIPERVLELFNIAGIDRFFTLMSVEEFEDEYLVS